MPQQLGHPDTDHRIEREPEDVPMYRTQRWGPVGVAEAEPDEPEKPEKPKKPGKSK